MAIINGRQMETTFWEDFTIADMFGLDAVLDTFRRAWAEWRDDPVYLAELCIVTNHKLWQHYTEGEYDVAKAYEGMYFKCKEYAYADDSPLSDSDRRVFFEITD